jgi:HYDIN/CFA65/VesB family protein/putative pyrroloquinoline-quinone binding quinoprotein/putative pyrroloquinoline-quinone-binding quinoprotein
MHTRRYLSFPATSARRLVLALAGLALALGMLPVVAGAVPGTPAGHARADDLTAGVNPNRDSWDSSEQATQMGPSVVPSFIQKFNHTVTGAVYAQPLVVGSTVYVATENDQVYALNAGTGAQIWHTSLGNPFNITKVSSLSKCHDLVPNIGVTGTPAYDPTSNELYMFANIVSGTNTPHYYLVGVNASSGKVVQQIHITGQPSNDSSIGFMAQQQMERPGVLFNSVDGSVWGAFASHCDTKPYVGFVVRVTPANNAFTMWSDESGTTYNQAGIWQGGSGLMEDAQHRIFLTSGNGVSPSTGTAGTSPPGQLAESVIQMSVNSNGTLKASDFFSPSNASSLDAADTDYGSGGPVGVSFAWGSYPNVLVQVGKDGRIFLLNRDGLGGRHSTDQALYVSKNYGGEWGHPALFGDSAVTAPDASDWLVYVGKNDVMRLFRATLVSGQPWMSNTATSSLQYGYTSGSPVVTSQGDDPTTAVIWEVYTPNTSGNPGTNSQLEAYSLSSGTGSSCTSTSMCTLKNIWTSPKFTSAKFSIPATSQGWVYVGTRDGHLLAFALPGAAAPAVASTATFAPTPTGSTTSQGVSLTAQQPVTVTGPPTTAGASNGTTTSPFTAGQVTLTHGGSTTPVTSYPVTLAKGDKLASTVTFQPSSPGGNSGTLSYPTSSAAFPAVSVPLIGEGTQNGLIALPGTIQFLGAPDQGVIPVAVGITVPLTVNITNFGTTTQTVTAVTPPSGPFSALNLPTVGQQIKPGSSITVQVQFSPTAAGPATGSLTIAGSSGPPAAVTLSGTGTGAVSQFTSPNPVVNFGTIPVGKKAHATVFIGNTGNTESTITGVAPMASPFAATLKPNPKMPFNAESDLAIPVTFTPTKKGTFSTQYTLTWSDVNGSHSVSVTLTGKAV